MALIAWLIVGLIAGALARLLVPGRDSMGLLGTLVLGLVGSLVGGVIAVALTDRTMDEFTASGLIGAVIGGVIVLLLYRMVQGRGRGAPA